jgi:hypothetical protein
MAEDNEFIYQGGDRERETRNSQGSIRIITSQGQLTTITSDNSQSYETKIFNACILGTKSP